MLSFLKLKLYIFQGDITINGNITARNLNPYYCAGKFNGTNLTTIITLGRQGFYITRPTGYAAGIYYIEFVNALPNADYIINLSCEGAVSIQISNIIRPQTTGFYIMVFNQGQYVNSDAIHFTVFAGY